MHKILYFVIICSLASLAIHSSGILSFLPWLIAGIISLGAVYAHQAYQAGARLRADILHLLWESHPLPIGTDRLADKVIAHRLASIPRSELERYAKKRWNEIGMLLLGIGAKRFLFELEALMDSGIVSGRVIGEIENDASLDVLWGIAPVTSERGPWGWRR